MNVRAKNSKQPQWQKIAGTLLVLAIAAGYWYFENRNQGGIAEGGNDPNAPFSDFQGPGVDLGDVGNGASSNQSRSNQSGNGGSNNAASLDSFFTKERGDTYKTPAGLVYTMGPRREHRRDHVLRHGKDQPGRPVHSVFDGSDLEIFQTIDEAYGLIKDESNQVKHSKSDGRDEYTIDMRRKVGYEGGQKGKRKNYPELRKVKLILQRGNQVVTAYPYR